jgi:hypothetical protein
VSVRRRKKRNTRRKHSGAPRALRVTAACALLLGLLALARVESTQGVAKMVTSFEAPADSLSWPQWASWRAPLRSPLFRVRGVTLHGLRTLDPGVVERALALPGEMALVDVDPAALCADLRKKIRRVADCEISRRPTGTLSAKLREREPIGVLANGEGVDAQGVRFALRAGEAAALPRVTGELKRLLPYLEAAPLAGVELASAATRGGARKIVELRPAGTQLRVLAGDDPLESLLRYRSIADSGVLDKLSARELDLRFRGRAFVRDLSAPDRGAKRGGA